MHENEISGIIIDRAIMIHSKLGPGLFELVYEEILAYELRKVGFHVERQKGLPVFWDDLELELGFRTDLIVEKKVIVELKSIEKLQRVHSKQLLTYLRLTKLKLGLLINFNEALLKEGIKRIANGL